VLRGDNVIAVNLEKAVGFEWLRECNTIEGYLLMICIDEELTWKIKGILPRYLDGIRVGNH
jgi:hypothetical protein